MAINNSFLDSILDTNLTRSGVFPPGTGASGNQVNALNKAIPGFSGLTQSASDIIGNLLKGLPSAAPAQRENAYFGVSSGMPNSEFVRNRGFDLYGEQAEDRKQRGFQDLLALLQGYSGTAVPTTGQDIQNRQFNQSLAFDEGQSAINTALKERERRPLRRENSFSTIMPLGARDYTYRNFD